MTQNESVTSCFVISPIGDEGSDTRKHADAVFDQLILPAMTECGIEHVVRSDHLHTPGRITDQMYRHILNDNLCVAVLTGHNPNVFYELAVAQARKRPVVLLIEKSETLPFDVRDLRCIYYDLNDRAHVGQLVGFVKDIRAANWRAPDIFAPFSDVGEGQAAVRRFCNGVEGEWWECITVKDRRSLSYFRIGFEELYNSVQMEGRVYDANGDIEAHWASAAAAVDISNRKIVYVRKCWHPARPDNAEYHGFGQITFETGENRNQGNGRFVDVGGVARPVLLRRVVEETEKTTMNANNAKDVQALVLKMLGTF